MSHAKVVGMQEMWYVYILQSESRGSYHIGYIHEIKTRLERHNDGRTRSTRSGRPWKLVYQEGLGSKGEAIRRELQLKQIKSRTYLERLIGHAGGRPDSWNESGAAPH
jgi:putative endonuclease